MIELLKQIFWILVGIGSGFLTIGIVLAVLALPILYLADKLKQK